MLADKDTVLLSIDADLTPKQAFPNAQRSRKAENPDPDQAEDLGGKHCSEMLVKAAQGSGWLEETVLLLAKGKPRTTRLTNVRRAETP